MQQQHHRRRERVAIAYDDEEKVMRGDGDEEGGGGGGGGDPELGFDRVAMFPEQGDNCAIATSEIRQGTVLLRKGGGGEGEGAEPQSLRRIVIKTKILVGHRFAVKWLPFGTEILSWGLPFGKITAKDGVQAGEYLCNKRMLVSLTNWGITDIPKTPNFEDVVASYELKDAKITEQVALVDKNNGGGGFFMGYPRKGGRKGLYGTRNYIVVMAATALSSPFVNALQGHFWEEDRSKIGAQGSDTMDHPMVVAVAHTESAGRNNHDILVRTLAAFCCHQNVAKCLIIDKGKMDTLRGEDIVREGKEVHKMPLLPGEDIQFHSLMDNDDANNGSLSSEGESYRKSFKTCIGILESWQKELSGCAREKCPLSGLTVALQCGGSDAFSGVSGNPIAGWASKYIIENGGRALLAETDELIGAESYILRRVKSMETARNFQACVERFKERMSWHGQTAEANPSGGNNLRGLYNIALKSLGAAKKKHADVRLDGVIEYASYRAMAERGYYFMDSPGNDLESIAGQVASGCNLILFVTGNGSITNFPFVPTIKILTTSRRYALLSSDMDFNAGRYQEGHKLSDLGKELFDDIVRVASGGATKGELAFHSQVSIWRNWAQSGAHPNLSLAVKEVLRERAVSPITITTTSTKRSQSGGSKDIMEEKEEGRHSGSAAASSPVPLLSLEKIGLIMPTSLCSGQIARLIAEHLNAEVEAEKKSTKKKSKGVVIDRFVALTHTEGCGMGYAYGEEEIYRRIVLGHVTHPAVRACLFLEHGCEKTHNGYVKNKILNNNEEDEEKKKKLSADDDSNGASSSIVWESRRMGFASIQRDGGIEKVKRKVREFFSSVSSSINTDDDDDENDDDEKGNAATPPPSPCIALLSASLRLVGSRGGGRKRSKSTKPLIITSQDEKDDDKKDDGALMAHVARSLVESGCRVVVPETALLLRDSSFVEGLFGGQQQQRQHQQQQRADGNGDLSRSTVLKPNLSFAQKLSSTDAGPGLYVMSSPTEDWTETLTGLAATGCIMAVSLAPHTVTGHPFVPVVRIHASSPSSMGGGEGGEGEPEGSVAPSTNPKSLSSLGTAPSGWVIHTVPSSSRGGSSTPTDHKANERVMENIFKVMRQELTKNKHRVDVAFQVSRGLTGISA
eukprot:jgi/Bigna1/67335/fgenesh1_pg.3_\